MNPDELFPVEELKDLKDTLSYLREGDEETYTYDEMFGADDSPEDEEEWMEEKFDTPQSEEMRRIFGE